MPQIKYVIRDIRSIRVPAADGPPVEHMVISWLEDGGRPYTLTMPASGYTPQAGVAAVEAQVRAHAAIVHHAGIIEA